MDPEGPEVHYTLLVRLPFARGDFVDPPQVEWNAVKDQALWEHISRSSKTGDLDWQSLAAGFDVPHAFLLQQAAWLYEHHLFHVRAQMRKVAPTAAHPSGPASGASGVSTVGGLPMKRLSSGGGSRAHSSMSVRQADSAGTRASGAEGSGAGARRPSVLSRNPSTATVTQSKHGKTYENPMPSSPRQPVHKSFRASYGHGAEGRPSIEQKPAPTNVTKNPSSPAATSPASSDTDDSSASDEANDPIPAGIRASQIVRRGPAWLKSQKQKLGTVEDESPERGEDDDDDESLPFAAATNPSVHDSHPPREDLTRKKGQKPERIGAGQGARKSHNPSQVASAAGPANRITTPPMQQRQQHQKRPQASASPRKPSIPDTASSSSASSLPAQHDGPSTATATNAGGAGPARNSTRKASALSPQHRAQLARLGSGGKQEGSEGTPSMGSSFSDLDDASISQSALEEALLSKMGQGGSRVSNFSTALRSKYLH